MLLHQEKDVVKIPISHRTINIYKIFFKDTGIKELIKLEPSHKKAIDFIYDRSMKIGNIIVGYASYVKKETEKTIFPAYNPYDGKNIGTYVVEKESFRLDEFE